MCLYDFFYIISITQKFLVQIFNKKNVIISVKHVLEIVVVAIFVVMSIEIF